MERSFGESVKLFKSGGSDFEASEHFDVDPSIIEKLLFCVAGGPIYVICLKKLVKPSNQFCLFQRVYDNRKQSKQL